MDISTQYKPDDEFKTQALLFQSKYRAEVLRKVQFVEMEYAPAGIAGRLRLECVADFTGKCKKPSIMNHSKRTNGEKTARIDKIGYKGFQVSNLTLNG